MSLHPKVNGAYKELTNCKVKVAGAWKQAETIYTKVNGVWKECWANLAIDTIINYGITNIPVKDSGRFMRLYGVTITITRISDGKVLQTITEEDTGEIISQNYSLKDGGNLSITAGDDEKSLDFEFWQSGSQAEVKIKKVALS